MALKLKRHHSQEKRTLQIENLELDVNRHRVTYGQEIIELTKKEFDLLHYFLENQNIVLTRDKILQAVWGYDYVGETNIVDVYIRYLRSKIDDQYNIKFIHTIRGVGYLLKHE